MASLFQIEKDLLELLNRLDDAIENNDLDSYDECVNLLKIGKEQLKEKALNYSKAIRLKESEAKHYERMEKEAKEAKKRCEKSIQRMKDALIDVMTDLEIKDIEVAQGQRIALQPSFSVEVDSTIGVPEEYIRVKIEREPDKKLLKEALDAGVELDGARIVRKEGIRFRGL